MDKKDWYCGGLLVLCALFSFYIRIVRPWKNIMLATYVNYGCNDPWYNMRLVFNTLAHFPQRIFYEPFTTYPNGTNVPFAPLFDYLLTWIVWLVGRGDPMTTLGTRGIETVSAIYPGVIGVLIIIPTYFIAKVVWNRRAGILAAALIAVLPGQFYTRSMLGFVDHDVMAMLLIACAMFFAVKALQKATETELTVTKSGFMLGFHGREWKHHPMVYSAIAGVLLGLGYLAWTGTVLLGTFILLLYAVIQFIVAHLEKRNTDYIFIAFAPALLIPCLFALPAARVYALSDIHVYAPIIAFVIVLVMMVVSRVMTSKGFDTKTYPIAILFTGACAFVAVKVLAPSVYATLGYNFAIFSPTVSQLTIAEVHPMTIFRTASGHPGAYQWFSTAFFFAFAGYAWLAYEFVANRRDTDLFIFVWGMTTLAFCVVMNRFAAFYALNVALLCGFIGDRVIQRGYPKLQPEKRVKGKKLPKKAAAPNKAEVVLVTSMLICAMVVPAFAVSWKTSAEVGGNAPYDWWESLNWLKANSPELELDYYGYYERGNSSFTYPAGTYSVISWWDYGHWITYISHRIPVANPFQHGIGGPYQSYRLGVAEFFCTPNESRANEIADHFDGRYVVTDFMMADAFNAYYNKFGAMTVWNGDTDGYYTQVQQRTVPSQKYFHTMVARLHILDGCGAALTETDYVEPLEHYRLVHESPSTILQIAGDNIQFVKVFEYVPGALIRGRAAPDSILSLNTTVKTNKGREYEYAQNLIVDETGNYEFCVPYSTEASEGVQIIGTPYILRRGIIDGSNVTFDAAIEIHVMNEGVVEGKEIRVQV